jgi:hypothetical protein
MNRDRPTMDRLKAIKRAHEARLMRLRNVVAVGIGYRQRDGQATDELAIVVSVTDKVPPEGLDEESLIPSEIDGVPVDVQVVGTIRTGER